MCQIFQPNNSVKQLSINYFVQHTINEYIHVKYLILCFPNVLRLPKQVQVSLGIVFFKKNQPTPASFHVFSSFQTNITILTTIKCEKCPSSIRCLDLNSQPFDSKSPPLTTRPGLLPKPQALLLPVMVKRQYDDGFLHAFGSTGIHGHW